MWKDLFKEPYDKEIKKRSGKYHKVGNDKRYLKKGDLGWKGWLVVLLVILIFILYDIFVK